MRKALLFSLLCVTVVLAGACSDGRQRGPVSDLLKPEVLRQADEWLSREPVTVTAFVAERSAGGLHDFYSEGDYWWPDPENPDGPYIRRDGESNPDNFSEHRKAMVDFSRAVGSLTSAWLLTGKPKYAAAVEKQIHAWFIDGETKINPNLLYAQAIKGRYTGRGIGIIDTLHLIEVAQSLVRLREAGGISQDCLDGAVAWFSEYLRWMSTHEYGLDEMNAKNNHGTCWALQAAAFARLTGDKEVTELCRRRFTEIFLPGQMDPDGSFPQELARTKPYGYSLFNLDAMAALCHILSEDGEDLWEYATEDGKCMRKALDFMLPYVQDKDAWPYGHDVMYWDEWPVAQPAYLLGWARFGDAAYFEAWKEREHFPTNAEVLRNLPLRNPVLWVKR